MTEIKFNQQYDVYVDNVEYKGLGLGDVCRSEKNYIIIAYKEKASLVQLEKIEGRLEGKIIDWNEVDNQNNIGACQDFCAHLLKKNGLLPQKAA